MRLVDLNSTTTLSVIGLLNCPITNCLITTWQVNKWKIGFFFKPIFEPQEETRWTSLRVWFFICMQNLLP